MSHAFYVYSAWGIGLLTLLLVTGFTWLQSVRLKGEIKRLEAAGIRRRSDPQGSGEAA